MLEVVTVFSGYEAVVKDSRHLVHPQSGKCLPCSTGSGGGHHQPLEHFAEITQVEGVVALCWCRQQLLAGPTEGTGKLVVAFGVSCMMTQTAVEQLCMLIMPGLIRGHKSQTCMSELLVN